jgi:hypothetical protein
LLAPPFNLVHCFPVTRALAAIDRSPSPDPILFAQKAFSMPSAFEFLELGYVWHFTNVIALRSTVMGEVWRRVRHRYPGAALPQ